MGMYDNINGEQVKCFPWVSLYKDEITYDEYVRKPTPQRI